MSGEYWVLKNVGIGLHAGWFGFDQPLETDGSALAGAFSLGARTSNPRAQGHHSNYGILNVDAGVGEYHLTERNGLCFSSECEEPHRRTDIAPYLGGSLGWLWHPGDVEIGPLLRFDVTGPVWAVTLNGALGFHFGTR